MYKKKIATQTILFIFIVSFIVIFKTIFGTEETLIGVMTITASLMFLQMNLTNNLIKNTAYILVIEVISGVASFIAVLSPWLGIPINFIIVFILGYSFCYSLKKPMYTPLILQYLFMLSSPVTLDILPKRLLSLFFGGVIIMLFQVIANGGKQSKKGKVLLSDTLNMVKVRVDSNNQEKSYEIGRDINLKLKELNRVGEEISYSNLNLINERNIILSIAIALKKLNENLTKVKQDKDTLEGLKDLSLTLELAREILNSKDQYDEQLKEFNAIISKYKHKESINKEIIRLVYSTTYLKDRIVELKEIEVKKAGSRKKDSFIHIQYLQDKEDTKVKSIRMSYGFRIALGVAITAFFTNYFNIVDGKWMMFTILALTVPIFEASTQKLKDRLFATFIGAFLAVIIYEIFKTPLSRVIILLITGYVNGYITRYKYNAIGVTLCSIGSAVLASGTPEILSIHRVVFVIIGAFLAFLINKFFFSYNLKDETKELQSLADTTLKHMIKEVYELVNGKGDKSRLVNLIITLSMVEEKLSENNFVSEDERSIRYLEKVRELESLIYELYMWIDMEGIVKENIKVIAKDMNYLLHINNVNLHEKIKDFQNQVPEMDSINDEISIIIMEDILKSFYTLKCLKLVI